jgi:hypothetical protein
MRRQLVWIIGLSSACGAPARETADTPPAADVSRTTDTGTMKTFDPASWNNRCVIAYGYAVSSKSSELLDLGGPTIGVVFDGDGRWQVPLGAWVQVRGTVVERSDQPVFIQDPNEPIMQGMPVPEGTDLEQARKRWVIEHATVKLLRTLEQVEAALAAQLGKRVELRGILWSRNNHWWFVHDGVDLHIERAPNLDIEQHGRAVTLVGSLSRREMPRIDQIGISAKPELAEAFVLRVDAIEPHPASQLEACQPSVEPTREIVDPSGPLEIEERGRLAKPSDYEPSREEGMTDEPFSIGWSKRTGEFSFCTPMGGAECHGCDFHRLGAEPERVETGSDDCNLPPVPGPELERRIAAGDFRVEDGPWAYGATVVLVVEQKQGKRDSEGSSRGVVQLGARLRAPDAEVAWLETIVECYDDEGFCAPDVHIDGLAPAPDGQTIAVLMHSFAGEFSDTYPLRMLDADAVAAAAYNQAGLARMRADDHEQAADYFTRVSEIDPNDWKGPYNLACTHARAGDEDATRRALDEALRRGGDAVRAKAAEDHDLDAMRERPWFPK